MPVTQATRVPPVPTSSPAGIHIACGSVPPLLCPALLTHHVPLFARFPAPVTALVTNPGPDPVTLPVSTVSSRLSSPTHLSPPLSDHCSSEMQSDDDCDLSDSVTAAMVLPPALHTRLMRDVYRGRGGHMPPLHAGISHRSAFWGAACGAFAACHRSPLYAAALNFEPGHDFDFPLFEHPA